MRSVPFADARWLRPVIFMLGLGPLLRLVGLALTGGLGVNPIEFVTRSLGTWALTFLWLSLALTPLRHWTGDGRWLRYRRMLGLYAFFYALLHWFSYVWLDQFFDVGEILRDLAKRPFIAAGMTAFLCLLPLALTSTDAAMRRLGRAWRRLHRLVYPAAIAALLHYVWLVKLDYTPPLIFAVALLLLLLARWPDISKCAVVKNKKGCARQPQ